MADGALDEEELVGRLHGRGDLAPVRVIRVRMLPGLLLDDEFQPVGSQVLPEQRVVVPAAAVSGEVVADEAAGRGEGVAAGEVPVRKRGRIGPRLGPVEAEMPLAGVPAAVAGRGQAAAQELRGVGQIVDAASVAARVRLDAVVRGLQPGHQARPGGGAHRTVGVAVLEHDGVAGEAVEVRRPAEAVRVVAGERVRPLLVGEDEKDAALRSRAIDSAGTAGSQAAPAAAARSRVAAAGTSGANW